MIDLTNRPSADERYDMNLLEVINIKSTEAKDIIKIIEICEGIKIPRSAELAVFRMNLSREVKCVIVWNTDSFPENKSRLGEELSQALSHYGQVSHTLWLEVDKSNIAD